MKTLELHVLLAGVPAGRIFRSGKRLSFDYDERFRESPDAIPLSLCMPLSLSRHSHAVVEPFLWGLLPDNERILERWGRRFGVSPGNAFALIAHVGEDCAGAVQFVRQERLDSVRRNGPGSVAWLSESDVAARLHALRKDLAAGRLEGDAGQFSLAGAQPKTALLFDGEHWGVPAGRTPTTHILKPPLAHLDGHLENEHLCLALARALGLPAARSKVMRFEDEMAICIERYDRLATSKGTTRGVVLRLHQEDLCQALGLPPALKYQSDGGPKPQQVVDLLRAHSHRPDEDIETFTSALVFNWLVAGTDAHAKNYSLLLGARGQVRLAPLYDLGSALPYPDIDQRRLKLAMKIGSTYKVREIGRRNLETFAKAVHLEPKATVERARALARSLQASLSDVFGQARADGLRHPIVSKLRSELAAHVARCETALR